jgi:hypothetical protein
VASQHQKYYPNQNLNRKETAIIGYIKEFENEPKRLTINQIASAMDKSGICSRLTTNKIINNLINLNIIIDEKTGNKFHRLKINKDYWLNPHKLEDELLKSKIQKALEPLKPLLVSKKMEVQLVNKVKGETDIIIGIESKGEKTRTNDLYIPKPLDQYPTDDVFTPKQLQQMAMDRQKKTVKKLRKDLIDHARKGLRDKNELRKTNKKQ